MCRAAIRLVFAGTISFLKACSVFRVVDHCDPEFLTGSKIFDICATSPQHSLWQIPCFGFPEMKTLICFGGGALS